MKPFVVMCVGKTHSGKTTLAKMLSEKLKLVMIDTDEIDQFCKKEYRQIVEYEKNNRDFWNTTGFRPFLKMQIQSVVYKYAIQNEMGVILSNGHSTKVSKEYQRKIADELGIKLVAINFEINDEIIRERIKTAKKDLNILTTSKDFYESLNKQNKIFEFAKEGEADYIFEIDATKDPVESVENIIEFLKLNGLVD